jgi:hypothetical protein|tara:strand:+ start:1036 stop:1413 length:378 start_codon:yes stop_codon:yes gene_type:complete
MKINPITNIFNQLPSSHNLVIRTRQIAGLLEGKTVFYDCENARDLDILKVNDTWQAKNGQHVLSVDVRDAGKTRVITMRANRIARINGEDARVIKTWTAPEKNEAREAMETGDWGKFFDSLSSLK